MSALLAAILPKLQPRQSRDLDTVVFSKTQMHISYSLLVLIDHLEPRLAPARIADHGEWNIIINCQGM